ncbi:uncharacterized protein BO80DRAFT_431939 [Aspergillus ibericus CBS 121593]|uniref:Uncharacterized protein n=1 Tax=Aspergillus ibericus CBS 121593 TaxID=1448316 RepID=A0A395HAH4_9EURO|nr:hypothetical protein BO80DRAFT_431939 [Aspergillus ibericus CBS 121593]RAL04842.1 hypothetical protein BO80DRAFT_431939 [Aspergillus ibericus CBS 121593]
MRNILAVVVAFAAGAVAQNVYIALPTAGQTVQAGEQLTVQIQRPTPPTNVQEMSIAIGLQSCGSSTCYPASEALGTILYNGAYDPVYHEYYLPQYQNITVTIPEGTAAGAATLGVAHATLIGALYEPYLQTLSQNLTIA